MPAKSPLILCSHGFDYEEMAFFLKVFTYTCICSIMSWYLVEIWQNFRGTRLDTKLKLCPDWETIVTDLREARDSSVGIWMLSAPTEKVLVFQRRGGRAFSAHFSVVLQADCSRKSGVCCSYSATFITSVSPSPFMPLHFIGLGF